jgi:carbonic anhydrase
MNALTRGHTTFKTQVYPRLKERFELLAHGQTPHTLFVTCSDSRVDPSLITQTDPGEIFVIRNAGNLVPRHGEDDGSAAAVEYAVAALKVERIVVCGHSGCGAVGGLLNPGAVSALPTVARWVELAAATREATKDVPDGERLATAVRHNAETQLENLMSHPSVAAAVEAGDLELEAWVYDIPSGEVSISAERG